MKTSIFRKINSQGRINLTKDFCDFVGINPKDKVALCKGKNGDELYILSIDKVKANEIIAFSKVDIKYRIVIPKFLVEKSDYLFEMFILERKIVLKSKTTTK